MIKKKFDAVEKVNIVYGLVSFGAVFYTTLWLPFALNATSQNWSLLAQISASLWAGTVVGEIPTGILTDRWGARRALLAYAGLSLLSALLAITGSAVPLMFFAAHFIQGIALSFLTGVFSLRLKEEQRVGKLEIDYKRAVSQGASYRSILSVAGIACAWICLRFLGAYWAFLFPVFVWAAVLAIANFTWKPLSLNPKSGNLRALFGVGAMIYAANSRFRYLSLSRIAFDFGSAALVEYAISLVAPNLSEGSNRYLIFSMIFAGIRLFSSQAVAYLSSLYTPHAFIITAGISLGLLLAAPALPAVIVLLLFAVFYLDYQIHSEALDSLDEQGASMAMSLQSLGMSGASAASLFTYSLLLSRLGQAPSLLILMVVGAIAGFIFHQQAKRTNGLAR